MGLNCAGPLIHTSFPKVNTTELHHPKLVESTDAEPQIWGNRGTEGWLYHPWTLTAWKVGSIKPHLIQGSTVYINSHYKNTFSPVSCLVCSHSILMKLNWTSFLVARIIARHYFTTNLWKQVERSSEICVRQWIILSSS